ncbi:MAG TPA: hypothetical protein VGG75_16735 [Trebonia sp.]|jgi:hypothetical protein
MKAIVPLNVAALRVSGNDAGKVTSKLGTFAGATAAFDNLPHGTDAIEASTGDTIWLPLAQDSPQVALETGVHLHWELPDYFKTGRQDRESGAIDFPHAPTRWLVVRSLSTYDPASSAYGPPRHASWILESDYVTAEQQTFQVNGQTVVRPAISIPAFQLAGLDASLTPARYMGRVLDAAAWDPASERPEDYLPHYIGPGGDPLYLTSVGFVGAAFSGYYPDCRSVFGFWDSFADVRDVYAAITGNTAVRFRVSYSVIGWLPDASTDPLAGLKPAVISEYETYLSQCAQQKVPVTTTPADVFARITSGQFGWQFSDNAVSCTLAADHTITDLEVPDSTLCAGVLQEVVWDQLDPTGNTPFLSAAPWTDEVRIAVGNTTVEAVSALVKSQLPDPGGDQVLDSYEMLLDALQLGLLRDLEGQGNSLITLEEALHAKAFSGVDGGYQWTIQSKAAPDSQAAVSLTLPLSLAEQLNLLNNAQRAYDEARDRLTAARQQLFMDWVIYVKQLSEKPPPRNPVISTNTLSGFLVSSGTRGELAAVVAAGDAAGLLVHGTDSATGLADVSTASAATTLAGQVVSAYQAVTSALAALHETGWELDAVPAPAYWQPTDPVLVLEGNRLEPVRRNGPTSAIAVRTDGELIDRLTIADATASWTAAASAVAGLPVPPIPLPGYAAAAAALGESILLDPQYATAVAAAAGAPDQPGLPAALTAVQGGQSPLDRPPTDGPDGGLYGAVHADGYQRPPNPVQSVQQPGPFTVTFTNATQTALAPDAAGWNAQIALPEFGPDRVDPFLPVWLTWSLRLAPLPRDGGSYAAGTLRQNFTLDADSVDLGYRPGTFTAGTVDYTGAVVLSKKPFASLLQQIDQYTAEFPHDEADARLDQARGDLAGRKILSQSLDTFNLAQTLRTTIPQIPVANLVQPDLYTTRIAGAATATPGDSWYDTGFNSLTAISTGLLAQRNYGPLRSGLLEVTGLRVVDVFGQIMNLTSAAPTAGGALRVAPAASLSPTDSADSGKIYLPPRALAPARVDAYWLSATHNDDFPAITSDFVEVNAHPATSPVCGWIVPNHLDLSLAFYDADSSPIGSFGIEHDASVYRTRAGNTANPRDQLEQDLGPPEAPRVNAHVAQLMRFISGRPAGFLNDLMTAIADSGKFINPASSAQDVALSVLVGRPLAITRMVQSISTAGRVLPASQANSVKGDALDQTVSNRWFDYGERQSRTCAGLDQVRIPVRLGELTDIDDGLVAFLPQADGPDPYQAVYSAAAPPDGANGVLRPGPDTVQLTINGSPLTFLALVDPRAPVHVTTGVLPTATMQIPPDQYLRAMQQLQITFVTRPVLKGQPGLQLPLPGQAGFGWSWVAPGAGRAPEPLDPQSAPDAPVYGYSPQRLCEGWLDLIKTDTEQTDGRPA